MFKKNLVITLSLLLLVSLFIGACGSSAPQPASKSEPAKSEEPAQAKTEPAKQEEPVQKEAPAAEAVTIRVWTHQNNAFNDGLQKIADAYTAARPNVSIEFESFDYDTYIQTLQTALPAGTEADILQMFGTWTCSYADGGNLSPVPDTILSLSDAQNAFFEAPLAGYTCGEKLYGLPQEFNIEYGATMVNTAMAKEAGIEDITKGWDNWDGFKKDAKALTLEQDGVVIRAGYNFTSGDSLGFTFFSLIKQQGGSYLNADGSAFTINTPEGKQALELMKSIVDEGIVDPVLFNDEANWVGDCMFEGNCAMGMVGPWAVAEYSADFSEAAAVVDYAQLPSLGDNPDFVADSGWGLTVSNNSKVQDAAWDFIKFAAMDEATALNWNIGSGTIPALKANTQGPARDKMLAEFPYFEAFLNILPYGTYIGQLPDRDLLWYDIAYPHILNMLQGNETIDNALNAMEQEANEAFK